MFDVKSDIKLKSDLAKRTKTGKKGGKGLAVIRGDSGPSIEVRFQAEIWDLFQKKVERIKGKGSR